MNRLPLQLRFESGQALLLVLLSMAVVLTIVLSILSRSVTDVKISSQDEDSLRAFSAAEAGVEQALVVGSSTGSVSLGNAQFSANVSGFSQGANNFSLPTPLMSGEQAIIWFVAHDASGNLICNATHPCFTGGTLNICWGKEGTGVDSATTPALEASVFYTLTPGDYSSVRIAREAIDPYPARRVSNSFIAPDSGTCQIGSETFAFQKTLNFSSLGIGPAVYNTSGGLQFLWLRLVYNSDSTHPVGVDVDFAGNSALPVQGYKIESLGTAGEANRKIEVFEGFSEPPPIFSAAVFSSGGIVK